MLFLVGAGAAAHVDVDVDQFDDPCVKGVVCIGIYLTEYLTLYNV